MHKKFVRIEDFLGEKSARFFSNGYKRAIRSISDVVITASGTESVCSVSLPADWSVKGGARQIAHLSSIDALLIALQLSEAYCVVAYALTASMRKEITISSFSMKAGKEPLENLENFKATVTLSSIAGAIYSFVSDVGGMVVELKLQLPFACHPVVFPKEGVRYDAIDTILGKSGNNFYGAGFADVSHDITDVMVDLDASSVTAKFEGAFPKRTPYQGMETMFDHHVSPIDAMVVLSQLGQCYLYLLDGISRANSSTLWMRAMTFSTTDPPVNDTSLACIEVVRSERILVEEKPWRCVNMKGSMGGMNIFYALGHALPF